MKINTGTRLKKTVIIAATAAFSLLVLALLVVPPVVVNIATNRHVEYGVLEDHPLQKVYTAGDFDLTAEDRMLTTEDGYQVWTSEVSAQKPKAVIIYLTGIWQPSVTYFYGHAKWMLQNGYSSFLLEVRGHGRSGGDRVCLGYEEVADVKAVVDYIVSQDRYRDVPIVIHGVSMGGAISINAFGQINELDGLIAMSPYSSFEDVMLDTMEQYQIPGFLRAVERPLITLTLRSVFGDRVDELKPIKQVENIGERPALFIASSTDTEVPAENMRRLLAAAPSHCESWLREEETSGHFIVLDSDLENVDLDIAYCETILSFLKRRVQ